MAEDSKSERKIGRNADGSFRVPLEYPESDRKFVTVKLLRPRILDEIASLGDRAEGMLQSDFLAGFLVIVSDVTEDEARGLAPDDVEAIREVVVSQQKKLLGG